MDSKERELKSALQVLFSARIALKKRLAQMHEDNNFNGKPFDLHRLKSAESDLAILDDEIEAMKLEIELHS